MAAKTETRKPNLETRRQILLLRHQGLNAKRIAQQLRIEPKMVSGYLRILATNSKPPERKRRVEKLPPLTTAQILGWARAFHTRHGVYPCITSGSIPDAQGEIWKNIDQALRKGFRGLDGGSSLRQLLGSQGHAVATRRDGWTREQDQLLGRFSDEDIAVRIGRTPVAVALRRRLLGIAKP